MILERLRDALARRQQERLTRIVRELSRPGWHYAWDLGKAADARSATTYRMLWRMFDNGWVEDSWEPDPDTRPPRPRYRLTDLGRDQLMAAGAWPR